MANFCGKCGSRLDKATGLCPKCDADKLNEQVKPAKAVEIQTIKQNTTSDQNKPLSKKERKKQRKADQKAARKAKKKEKRASMTFGQKVRRFFLKLLLWLILLALLSAGVVGLLLYNGVIEAPHMNDILPLFGMEKDNNGEAYFVEAPDAEAFYEENSSIVSEIDVNDSVEVLNEKEACNKLIDRGFSTYSIETEYSMDGTYHSAVNISDASDVKHPIYQTYYLAENGEIWTIFLIDGAIMANPVSFNMQSELGAQVIISEKDTVTSYDSTVNKFFETIPDESALIVITVDRIDAETLERLTIGEIDNHV